MKRHTQNGGKIKPEKSTPARTALLAAAFLLLMIAIGNSGPSMSSSPFISSASLDPLKVRPGDSMLVSVQASDPSGVSQVSADMGGIEAVSFISMAHYNGWWKHG